MRIANREKVFESGMILVLFLVFAFF